MLLFSGSPPPDNKVERYPGIKKYRAIILIRINEWVFVSPLVLKDFSGFFWIFPDFSGLQGAPSFERFDPHFVQDKKRAEKSAS